MILSTASISTAPKISPSRAGRFDADWQFFRNYAGEIEPSFFAFEPGLAWENVRLPHTARLEPLVTTQQWQGTCLYRKFFSLAADDHGKYVALRFEAAMHEARIYLDGELVGEHAGGYLPFTIDLTRRASPERIHCLLVWLNNEDNPLIPPGKPVAGLDFQYFSGLYRSVTLVVQDLLRLTDPVTAERPAGGGVRVHYENVTSLSAEVCVQTEVFNGHAESRDVCMRLNLVDAAGALVACREAGAMTIAPDAHGTWTEKIKVSNPRLWLPADPYLYRLQVEVLHSGRTVDRTEQPIGVRTIRIAKEAFYLNGERLWLRGANRHQEYPYVGYALSDPAQWRDAWKIKSAGFNFVRCSHYPQSPAFLDACDELGLLVTDSIPGWQFFGDTEFQRRALQDVRTMVRRDRHHPSIVMWEASLNETKMSREFMEQARRAVHEELPGADVFTSGFIEGGYDLFAPARAHDRSGRHWRDYAGPQPLFIAEYGDWEFYAYNEGFAQTRFKGLMPEESSSRQLRKHGEKRLARQARNFQEAHNDNFRTPAIGAAIWVMFDYNRGYAPDLEASGIMDIFRLPKPVFYFYQSQATRQPDARGFGGPMVHIASNWTSTSSKRVVVYSNCDEVELRLNGTMVGRREPDLDSDCDRMARPPFTFTLEKFVRGTLHAIGYIGGRACVEARCSTPGRPHALRLRADFSGQPLRAGINDLIFVYAEIVDLQGVVVPDASPAVGFGVNGDASLLGDNPVIAEAGIATVLLRAGLKTDTVHVRATADGLVSAELAAQIVP